MLPCELLLTRPVPAQTDLYIAPWVDRSRLDEPVHRRPVREFQAEIAPGVCVSVEVHQAERTVHLVAGAHVGLGDRVIAAEDHRDRSSREHGSDSVVNRLV